MDDKYAWKEPSVTYAEDIHPFLNAETAQAAAVGAVAYALAQGVGSVAAALTTTRGYVGKPIRS